MMNKPRKTGIARLVAATRYSAKGLRAAWIHEEAFRLEATLCVIFAPLGVYLGETPSDKLWLMGTCVLVVIVELINSAIEAIVDRISLETHPLSGQAKDLGSAAVFASLLLCVTAWGIIFWPDVSKLL